MPMQHGAPIRLVIPWKYGFKSIKSIVKIELTAEQPRTFWNDAVPREYDFLANVESAPYQLNEDMWDPEVRVDGPLATLWAPYGFHRDAEFSHWGHDAFHLVRDESGWRIVATLWVPLDFPSKRG